MANHADLEILVTTRRVKANEWLRDGHELLTVETVQDADRFPGDGQTWEVPPEQRGGHWYVRKRVAYIFLRRGTAA
jgi:hypothetical protein